MKSVVVTLSLIVGSLLWSASAATPAFAAISDPTMKCERLEDSIAKQKHLTKKLKSKRRRVPVAIALRLKATQRLHSRTCNRTVCGNVNTVINCEESGADFCTMQIVEGTFQSLAEMRQANASFLYFGECRDGGLNYGAPELR